MSPGRIRLTVIISLFLLPLGAAAEVQTITATGSYKAGAYDTRPDAQRLALLDAKRRALEQSIESLMTLPSIKQMGIDQDRLKAYLVPLIDFKQVPPTEGERAQPDAPVHVAATFDPIALERALQTLLHNERAKAELTRARDKIEGYRKEVADETTRLAAVSGPAEAETLLQRRRDVMDLMDTEAQLIRTWGLLLATQGPKRSPVASTQDSDSHDRASAPPAAGSDNAEEHRKKGVALNKDGRYDDAIAEFNQALQLVPNLPRTHLGIGVALQSKGDFGGAITEYQIELLNRPDDADAHNNLATALQNKGDVAGAITEYRTALRLKPDDALTHFNLGTALAAKDQTDDAVAEYKTAIKLRPNFAEAHFDLGTTLKGMGQSAEAAEALQNYVRLAPDIPANKQWLDQAKKMLQDIGEKPRRQRRQGGDRGQ